MNTTIEIPISDFYAKDNKALVPLLKIVRKAGPSGIGTRMLCVEAFDSKSYGLKILKRAEESGFITRTGKCTKRGGGTKRVCQISEKGKKLLEQLAS